MCGHFPMKVSACFVYKEADLRSFLQAILIGLSSYFMV